MDVTKVQSDAKSKMDAALEQLRKQAVRLKKQGNGVTEIGRILGVRRQTVSAWWTRYQETDERERREMTSQAPPAGEKKRRKRRRRRTRCCAKLFHTVTCDPFCSQP